MSFRAFAIPFAALTAIAGMGLAAPASVQAQDGPSYLQAQLVVPAEESRVIAGGIMWRCEGTSCTAAATGKRPLRACRDLFREVGVISSFSAGGEVLEQDRLARCNR